MAYSSSRHAISHCLSSKTNSPIPTRICNSSIVSTVLRFHSEAVLEARSPLRHSLKASTSLRRSHGPQSHYGLLDAPPCQFVLLLSQRVLILQEPPYRIAQCGIGSCNSHERGFHSLNVARGRGMVRKKRIRSLRRQQQRREQCRKEFPGWSLETSHGDGLRWRHRISKTMSHGMNNAPSKPSIPIQLWQSTTHKLSPYFSPV